MKKQKIEKWEYILDHDEMKDVINAFRYVRHRILEHNSKGAKTVSLEKIENILKDFDYRFSYEYEK